MAVTSCNGLLDLETIMIYCDMLDRKSRKRRLSGCPKMTAGSPSSTMAP
jgi:hypothetical protein